MTIALASDHRGYELKSNIILKLQNKYDLIDLGTTSNESTDYPLYAFKLGEFIRDKKADFGIAICGTGIGISIACNKVKGIRCAKISNVNDAYYAHLHNNANIIAFGEDTSIELAIEMIETYINTPYSDEEKHHRRVEEIDNYKWD